MERKKQKKPKENNRIRVRDKNLKTKRKAKLWLAKTDTLIFLEHIVTSIGTFFEFNKAWCPNDMSADIIFFINTVKNHIQFTVLL